MTIKITDNRSSATIRTVPSFASMTPEEQARHLVQDHGFNTEQFDTTEALSAMFPDNDAVVAAFVRAETDPEFVAKLERAGDGNSIPWGLTSWHEGDHNGDGTLVGGDYAESGLKDTVGLHIHQPFNG